MVFFVFHFYVNFRTVPTVWYSCFSFYVNFRTVPTVWYFLFFIFMLILELFQQCGILVLNVIPSLLGLDLT